MSKFLGALRGAFGVLQWLEIATNRRRVYTVLAAVGPLLAVAGVASPTTVTHWLDVVSGVLTLGVGSLAVKNTVEPDRVSEPDPVAPPVAVVPVVVPSTGVPAGEAPKGP